MEYNARIVVSQPIASRIQRAMDWEEGDSFDFRLDEEDTIRFTAHFSNGLQADVKCCGVQYREDEPNNSAWAEMVLFSGDGTDLAFTEPEDDFFGCWSIEYDDILYNVYVVEEGHLFIDEVPLSNQKDDAIKEYLLGTKHLAEGEQYTITTRFGDGVEMDISCCGRDAPCAFTEAQLFFDGNEVAHTDPPGSTIYGTWTLAWDGVTYQVNIKSFAECMAEKGKMVVETKLGKIISYPSNDDAYPGIHVEFLPNGMDCPFAITTIETHDEDDDGILYRHDWNDPRIEDPDDPVMYRLKDFQDAYDSVEPFLF